VVSYTVAQRTREVGVRVALGATPRDIVRLILSRVAALVVTGMGIGIIAALVATRFLDTLVFGVSPSDAPTYAASLAVLGTVALIAHLLPLRRALRVDPADALRHE
jgi:putative ABC transport system permease protein